MVLKNNKIIKIILLLIIILMLGIAIFILYLKDNIDVEVNNIVETNTIDKVITKDKDDNIDRTQTNLDANLEKRFILAEIIKKENDIVITEDNIDNSFKIIEEYNFKKGIYITEQSREEFLEITKGATLNEYIINEEGYLEKPITYSIVTNLSGKLNQYIDSDNNSCFFYV